MAGQALQLACHGTLTNSSSAGKQHSRKPVSVVKKRKMALMVMWAVIRVSKLLSKACKNHVSGVHHSLQKQDGLHAVVQDALKDPFISTEAATHVYACP